MVYHGDRDVCKGQRVSPQPDPGTTGSLKRSRSPDLVPPGTRTVTPEVFLPTGRPTTVRSLTGGRPTVHPRTGDRRTERRLDWGVLGADDRELDDVLGVLEVHVPDLCVCSSLRTPRPPVRHPVLGTSPFGSVFEYGVGEPRHTVSVRKGESQDSHGNGVAPVHGGRSGKVRTLVKSTRVSVGDYSPEVEPAY